MGILKRQYQRDLQKQKQNEKGEKTPDEQPRGQQGMPLSTVLLIVFVFVLIFPAMQFLSSGYQPMLPLQDLGARATQLAQQQGNLQDSMTRAAGASTDQALAAQMEIRHQQDVLSTEIARATATESIRATNTSWALTQTPMAAEQMMRDMEVKKAQTEAQWSTILAPLKAIVLTLIGLGFVLFLLVGCMYAFWRLLPVLEDRLRVVKEDRGERTIHVGQRSITRVDLMHQPVVTFDRAGHATGSGGASDEATQERIAHNAAKVKAIQGYPPGTKILKSLAPPIADAVIPPAQTPEMLPTQTMFPLPDWSIMESWDRRGGLPYGLSARGLELMDLNTYPHVGIFGKTGSGKSRRFLRPFLAGALAAGQRVVIIGKSVDFWPFQDHPNATLIPIQHFTFEHDAERYAYYLRMIVEEMNKRDGYLTAHQKSTWSIAGYENTLVVLDELGNSLGMMSKKYRDLSYSLCLGLLNEGRKAGFNIVFSSQRTVGFRGMMTQISKAVFFVEDEQESRYALGALGAEQLAEGYFYSKFGALKLTGAFEPTDQQIIDFLKRHDVKELEKPDWIDAESRDIHSINMPKDAGQLPPATIEAQIRQKLEEMKTAGTVSLSQVQRDVYGTDDPRGGRHFKLIQEIWLQMQTESATATQNNATFGHVTGSASGIATG